MAGKEKTRIIAGYSNEKKSETWSLMVYIQVKKKQKKEKHKVFWEWFYFYFEPFANVKYFIFKGRYYVLK